MKNIVSFIGALLLLATLAHAQTKPTLPVLAPNPELKVLKSEHSAAEANWRATIPDINKYSELMSNEKFKADNAVEACKKAHNDPCVNPGTYAAYRIAKDQYDAAMDRFTDAQHRMVDIENNIGKLEPPPPPPTFKGPNNELEALKPNALSNSAKGMAQWPKPLH